MIIQFQADNIAFIANRWQINPWQPDEKPSCFCFAHIVIRTMKREVLSLYKRILQLSRSWNAINPSNTQEERKYIQEEAKTWFRRNRNVSDTQSIIDYVKEGEARIGMGIV